MFLIIRVNDQAFCISSQTCKVSSFSYQKVFKKLLLREFSDRSIYFFLHLAGWVESFLLYNLDELSWFKMLYFEHMIWFNKKEINEAPPYIYNTIYIYIPLACSLSNAMVTFFQSSSLLWIGNTKQSIKALQKIQQQCNHLKYFFPLFFSTRMHWNDSGF